MNSIYLAGFGLGLFFLGYRFYSKYLSEKIYDLQSFSGLTPAHEFKDNIDFIPTKKPILFGHHFTSIAGAAPIIGPCIAAYWGWLPALLWIVIGTVFMGAVHDFGALVISVREKGRSIADITGKVISHRAKIMFLFFILMLTWLVLAVFAMAIAGLFNAVPTSVLPINIEIIIALIIGTLIYKKNVNATIPSVLALAILYLFVWIGTKTPITLSTLGVQPENTQTVWIIFLFIYSGIAGLLPVWLLLQPRDYINSHQLMVGLGLIFVGLFIAQPVVDAPMVRSDIGTDGPPIFPLLFVTIACGAISGFHGLVSSGTTSKQVNNIQDTRLIGYGSMIGEGALALASTIAAVAGIALVTTCNLPSVGVVADLNWHVYYDNWANASANKATAFVLGGGALLQQIGFEAELAKTLMAVLVISFAATTLDTATRIQRFIIGELGDAIHKPILKNRVVGTFGAILPAFALTMWSVPDPFTGQIKETAWIIWPIFGASNQMLAALTLMVIALYFLKLKKPIISLVIPFTLITGTTIIALLINAQTFYQNNSLLFGVDILLLGLVFWMLYEGWSVFKKMGKNHE
ncbi:MAG: carbon starvation protein A [Candidatus Marinimicrobia bacterium]|jgi:carbon starvation protein|nr:carbon starvation protein A [Candidatus Neomarinimicrobiota bacterium]MBT3961876.1 carbon starvation protein A [Candidatus Neomarinimicrobiota bacterium]MBT4382704.1 carbon starvation protein A [Candidatus Neomarinimicrobiota bacterium]MBT4636676.1 carbon starvation protein A [Candidatus Neomarinimicrobiota bacterium]MBT4685361.1 carbon starvation protein A [Candidatus Neomarinimicrobiota bacterium]